LASAIPWSVRRKKDAGIRVAGVWRFRLFRAAPPRLWPYFNQRENRPPAVTGVVHSYGMWQTEYGGRDGALGRLKSGRRCTL
jgi:hypothetical protein